MMREKKKRRRREEEEKTDAGMQSAGIEEPFRCQ